MRATLGKQFGGPDVLEIREIPEPEPRAGHAAIQVKAFQIAEAKKLDAVLDLVGNSATLDSGAAAPMA